jgi:hypothetical protein
MEKIASLLPEKPKKYDGLWLSVSKAKTFDSCGAKFKYTYIERLPRKTWDFHVLGKFAHEVMELFQKARLGGNDSPDHILMTEAYNDALKTYKKDLTDEHKKLVYDWGCEYLELAAQQKNEGTLPKVVGVESSFYIDIGGDILLNGFIDLEKMDSDNILHLADYKTSKSDRYLKNDFFQLMVYAYAKCIQDPSLEKVRCSYIMLRQGFKHITKEFHKKDIMKIQDKLLDYGEKIRAEKLYRPNPQFLCSYCDHVDICKAGFDFVNAKKVGTYGSSGW